MESKLKLSQKRGRADSEGSHNVGAGNGDVIDPRASQGNMSGYKRGWIGFSASEEGKIHDIVLSSKGIANFVKSWTVTKGISRGFIAKRVL